MGNSITNNGEFHHNILLYHLTRYPSTRVTFYNCGISGNSASDVLERMDNDILNLKPDYAVMMIGMNDVKRTLYGVNPTTNADTLRMRKEALVAYKANVEKTIGIFLKNNIKVILETPSIYDQTSKIATPRALGVNDALGECAVFLKEMAIKYNLKVVDYWSFMNAINIREQKANPEFTLTSKDRVHPESTGHLVMAYQFLKSMGATGLISKISVDKTIEQSKKRSQHCEFISQHTTKNGVTFEVKEHALPFPMMEHQKLGADLVELNHQLNSELLTVKGLENGDYNLLIDGQQIAMFTSKQLAETINLALFPQTPQYQQALLIKKELLKLRSYEAKLRGLKFIEYNSYFQQCEKKTNLNELKATLAPVFKDKYASNSSYYLTQLDNYIELKPQEENIKAKMEAIRESVKELVIPKPHKFTINLISL